MAANASTATTAFKGAIINRSAKRRCDRSIADRTANGKAGFTVRQLESLMEVPRGEWNELFPGRAESWDYFLACEMAAPKSFTLSAIAVFEQGTLIAAAPMFQTRYRLDMALPERLSRMGAWLAQRVPTLVNIPIVGLGSPLTEECPIGLHPRLNASERKAAFEMLLNGLEEFAKANGIKMLALKDMADCESWMHDLSLAQLGFTKVPTLPIATLHLPFGKTDDYLASLSSNTRKSLKKKLRDAGRVEVEICHSIRGIESEISELFLATKTRSKADYDGLDDVPAGYFQNVVEGLGEKALVVLLRVDGVLAGFSLSLIEEQRIIGKYVGMRYPLAQEHDVYFINWMTLVRYCITHRIPWLQTGQTTYREKIRLGCQLRRSSVCFKHRGLILGPIVRAVGAHLRFDTLDPDLQERDLVLPYIDTNPDQCARNQNIE